MLQNWMEGGRFRTANSQSGPAALLEVVCIYLRVRYRTLILATFNLVTFVVFYQPFFQQLKEFLFVISRSFPE